MNLISELNQTRLIFSATVLGVIFVVRYAIVWLVRSAESDHGARRLHGDAASQTFTVGDRIAMGGVRGDVVDLGFLQTRILEMGVPREMQGSNPSWIHERQYTGRIVTVTNDKVFDEPIFNYTREFPFMFDEIEVPLENRADRDRVEQIMIESAARHTNATLQRAIEASKHFEKKYFVDLEPIEPRVYYHIREGILEMHVRYVTTIYDQRDVQDKVKRAILAAFDRDNIAIKDMS